MRVSIIPKADVRAFERANEAVISATRRDAAEVINRALKDVAFLAARNTTVTEPARIEAELRSNKLALKIAAKRLGKGASRKAVGSMARKIISTRKRGARVMRVGWLKPLQEVGGKASLSGFRPTGVAARSYGIKATSTRLVGEIANAPYSRRKGSAAGPTGAMMRAALRQAVRAKTADQVAYANKKIAATVRRILHL